MKRRSSTQVWFMHDRASSEITVNWICQAIVFQLALCACFFFVLSVCFCVSLASFSAFSSTFPTARWRRPGFPQEWVRENSAQNSVRRPS